MTQPIQEPNLHRTDSRLSWGQNQLFRRPGPVAEGGTLPYCWGRWVGSEAITANTLSNPATVGTPDDPYEESSIYDPDALAGFSFNLSTGCLSWTEAGEYYVWASAEWNGTGSIGETLACVIDYGTSCTFSTNRAVAMIVADSTNQNMQIPVDRMISDFNGGSVRALVYHTDAGGNNIGAVWIHCVQINPNLGEFFT